MRLQLHQEMRSTLTTIQRIQEDLRRGVGLPNARCAAAITSSCRDGSYQAFDVPSDLLRLVMEPLEASQLGSAPQQHAAQLDAQPDGHATQPLKVATATPAAEPAQPVAAQSIVRAVPVPALRLEHFQTADVSSAQASDMASSAAVSLSNFDHAAYAEFQALFDVPAGRSAPYLLPPDKSRGRSVDPAVSSTSADAPAVAEQSAEVPGNGAGSRAVLIHSEVTHWVREYLQSDAGRAELARALKHLDGGKAGR